MRRFVPALFLLLLASGLFGDQRSGPQQMLSEGRSISLRIIAPGSMDENLQAVWRIVVTNTANAPVRFRFQTDFYSVDHFVSMPADCGLFLAATCDVDIAAMTSRELAFTVRYSTPIGHFHLIVRRATGAYESEEAVFARPFVVTHAGDSGPGSLRQAILDINTDCAWLVDPCGVVFHIDGPVPEEGWFTIRPQTPLPAITAPDVVVDGGTQSRYSGETNPFGGPEIYLDGSALQAGHGMLFIDGRVARATDLAIGFFPGNGIESTNPVRTAVRTVVQRNYLGVDPSGRIAAPNGLRGVQINAGDARVVENVLSGNRRAGGFFSTSGSVEVFRNRVGVGADGATPLGNGASGLFFGKPSGSNFIEVASGNIIANNAHAGIALSMQAMGLFGENEFRNNAGLAIDIGIDGNTRDTIPGLSGWGGVFGAPVITSARFEDGTTVIEGHVAEHPTGSHYWQGVFVYASGSPRNAEEVIAVINTRSWSEDRRFVIHVPADLRGQWIAAASFMEFEYLFDFPTAGTSELGEARRVD